MKTAKPRLHALLFWIALVAALTLSRGAAARASSLVGVNFSAASSHPTNWTPLPSVVSPVNNLMAEDGTITSIDLSFAAVRLFSGTINASTVPIHTPSLASLNGNVYNDFSSASLIALFSDLTPNQDYYDRRQGALGNKWSDIYHFGACHSGCPRTLHAGLGRRRLGRPAGLPLPPTWSEDAGHLWASGRFNFSGALMRPPEPPIESTASTSSMPGSP